jgi:hypothetical protein
MPQRELEQEQPEVSVPPSWESSPWTAEDRTVAQPEEQQEETPLTLADQKQHVVDLTER